MGFRGVIWTSMSDITPRDYPSIPAPPADPQPGGGHYGGQSAGIEGPAATPRRRRGRPGGGGAGPGRRGRAHVEADGARFRGAGHGQAPTAGVERREGHAGAPGPGVDRGPGDGAAVGGGGGDGNRAADGGHHAHG